MAMRRNMRRVTIETAGLPLKVMAVAIPSGKAGAVKARVKAALADDPKPESVGVKVRGHRRAVAPGRMVLVGGYTRGR